MAAYSNGNAEISVGQEGGLQTMVLMNPTTAYAQFNSNNSTPHALHAPPHQQQQFDGVSVLHAYVPPHHHHHHSHYNNPLVTFNSGEGARGAPRAGGLSLSLSSSATCFGGMGNGNGNGVVFGVQGLVMSSKFVKAAQELLDEVVSVDNGGGGGGNMHKSRLVGDGDGGKEESKVGDETDCGGGATGTKVAAEITAAERQEIQTKKAKLISMLDEVDQRYRQYKQQMQTVISSFEQAAGPNSAKTYTSLALKTISKQFRTLKDTITSQIRAANKTLGEQEEDRKKEGESSSRLKFVDHHLRQQRALQQLGMTQHNNAWRPQRGLPERAVSVLRAWLFEHFLHPYPKDSDKIILAKQTGLTRSQVSNWFINARVRLWKPMVEEMYIEEMKDQENSNGSETGKNKQQQQQHKEDSASNLISFNKNQEQQSSVLDDQGTDFRPKQETFMNSHSINPSISVPASVSAPHRCGNLRNPSGFLSTGPLELIEGITQWRSPKKPRSSSSIDNNNNKQQFSMELRDDDETQYSFVDNNTNFVGGFETGRFEAEAEADQFHTPRYSGNGVLLTLGLPHCDSFSVSGTHQNFLPNQNIQQQPDEFGSMSASVPHSSAAYDTISIQNQRRFVAQLLPDYVS